MTKQEFLAMSLPHRLRCQYEGIISYDIELEEGFMGSILKTDSNHKKGNKVGYLKEIHQFKNYYVARCGVRHKGLKAFANGTGLFPIIRHPSDLTKPIIQANYNNGKPFIPIVELAKEFRDRNWTNPKFIDDESRVKDSDTFDEFWFNGHDFYCYNTEDIEYTHVENQFELHMQLIKWHFWPDMPEGEKVVYITDEFNPYA